MKSNSADMPKLSKEKVINYCKSSLKQKMEELNSEIAKIEESAANETKSSMGDKYETGREMMMQEKVKLNGRLETLVKQMTALGTIDETQHQVVKNGSLVETTHANFFIIAAIGVLEIEREQVYVISQVAPFAKELIGKREGDEFHFNGRQQHILSLS